jgi:hypothetical protein
MVPYFVVFSTLLLLTLFSAQIYLNGYLFFFGEKQNSLPLVIVVLEFLLSTGFYLQTICMDPGIIPRQKSDRDPYLLEKMVLMQ